MIILPTAASTFGDSTHTEGPFRKYVLAQFRADADLDWVSRARGVLVREELKYRDLREARPRLRKDVALWAAIERGIGQATIVVVDPAEFDELVRDTLGQEEIERSGSREKAIIQGCATEIVQGTPLAYLPENLALQLGWPLTEVVSLSAFAPTELTRRLGGGLDKAMIFAARAHAVFDVPRMDSAPTTQSAVRSARLARVVLPEVLSTARVFDAEHPASAKLLNEASETIASAIEASLPIVGSLSPQPLVVEVDSRGIDAIQAADVAAGWAREVLETSDTTALGSRFERVWVNGRRIK